MRNLATSFPSSCCSGIGRRVTGLPPTRYLQHTYHPPNLPNCPNAHPPHPFLYHIFPPYFRLALSLAGIIFVLKQLLKVFENLSSLCSLKSIFRANVSVPLLSSAPQAASGNVRPGKHSPSPHPPPPPQTSPSFSFNLSPNLLMGKPRVGRKWNLVDQNKYEKGTLKIF